MSRHFAEISPVYRSVRTTDREPVERIARELDGRSRLEGADVGCGDGRYDLAMFETIPNLSLTCIDASAAMLEQVGALLRASGIERFRTRHSTARESRARTRPVRLRVLLQRRASLRGCRVPQEVAGRVGGRRRAVRLHPATRAQRAQHLGTMLPGLSGQGDAPAGARRPRRRDREHPGVAVRERDLSEVSPAGASRPPHIMAKLASERSRSGLSPTATIIAPAFSVPTPSSSSRLGASSSTSGTMKRSSSAISSLRSRIRRARYFKASLVATTGSRYPTVSGRHAAQGRRRCIDEPRPSRRRTSSRPATRRSGAGPGTPG